MNADVFVTLSRFNYSNVHLEPPTRCQRFAEAKISQIEKKMAVQEG